MQTMFNTTKSRVRTNCPLFSWMMRNEENFNQTVALGLIENRPFSAGNYSAVGFELMTNIVRKKLIINKDIEIAVDKRFEVIGSEPVVGFHIRKGDQQSDFKETRNFLYSCDMKYFMKCSVFSHAPNASIFIASDSTSTKYSLVNKYPNKRIVVFNVTAEHTASAVRKDSGKTALQSVFVDMMTLARCTYIVGTYKSTFSTLAAAFQGHIPFYVRHRARCFLPYGIIW